MSAPDPSRADLYNLLRDRIGPEATEALMTHLHDADEFVTEAMLDATETRLLTRMDRIEVRLDQVDARFDQLEVRVDRLDERFSRLQTTLIGGFAAIVASVIATGALG